MTVTDWSVDLAACSNSLVLGGTGLKFGDALLLLRLPVFPGIIGVVFMCLEKPDLQLDPLLPVLYLLKGDQFLIERF